MKPKNIKIKVWIKELTKEITTRYTKANKIMDEVFFITDVDTPLGKDLAKLALHKGYTVLGTISEDGDGNNEQKAEKIRIAIGGKKTKDILKIELWRRHSPVSARHILIKALTHFNTLSHVLLIGNPALERYELKQITLQQIESQVDGWIKGNFYLVKEFFNHFSQNGNKGNFAFICQNHTGKPLSVINEVLRGSFIGLASSLLTDSEAAEKRRGLIMNGFDSFLESDAGYADFIFNTLQEKAARLSGKWFKQHNGLISRLTKR